MKTNVLVALDNYTKISNVKVSDMYSSIGINRSGDRLEYFIKDIFSDSLNVNDKNEKVDEHKEYFSWLGSRNHPPDIIIDNGDAIEVKKTTSLSGRIQLNSSNPHQKLKSDSSLITNECRNCEDDWDVKDFAYIIGRIPRGENEIDFIWMVYGDCWCAKSEVYKNLSDKISDKINEGVDELPYGKLNKDSNEIGRLNEADFKGRTHLRIRGMWTMVHPANYFSKYIDNYDNIIENKSPMFIVLKEEKYMSFPVEDRQRVENNSNITIKSLRIDSPNQDDEKINVKLISATN